MPNHAIGAINSGRTLNIPNQTFYRVINGTHGVGSMTVNAVISYNVTTEVLTAVITGDVTAYNTGESIETAISHVYIGFSGGQTSAEVTATATCTSGSWQSVNANGTINVQVPIGATSITLVLYLYARTGSANPEGDTLLVPISFTQ